MTQTVKNLPAVQDTWVRSLDWEDCLEKGMATHSCSLVGCSPCKEWDMTEQLTLSLSISERKREMPHPAC